MSNFENVTFFDEEALLDRLSDGLVGSPKEVVFVVGAPLTAPEEQGQPGVYNVSKIIECIRSRFPEDAGPRLALDRNIAQSPNQYQAAFQFLQGRRGQDACNQVVREAVFGARETAEQASESKIEVSSLSDEQVAHLDEDKWGWHLSSGVEALGQLLTEYKEVFGKTLLTSNFDPLIEVAIRRVGGEVWQTSLISDADLGNTRANGCRVVHFHGYWHGTDTLHTGQQLLQSRPALKASLLEYLKDKLVVVLAYGGWEDILTSALKDLSGNPSAFPELLWAFYDTTPTIPLHLRSVLQPGLDRGRASLYSGIDCHTFLNNLLDRWRNSNQKAQSQNKDARRSSAFAITSANLKQLECDRPPNIEAWVGRDAELRSLEATRAPVVILTGIGGQGKSVTAAKYIQETFKSTSKYHFWDWRDCKEAADSIRTQVIASIDRITSEKVTSEMLSSASDSDLAELLVECSEDAKTIFVLDNVDHYVDLENFRFVGLLDQLVMGFANADTTSQLLLTCRPQVKYTDVSVISIPMPGLSLPETRSLFRQREVPEDIVNSQNIKTAHELTEGHPFWLDLMAVQVAQVPGTTLDGIFEDLRRGREESPNILSSIWMRLPEKEQTLLRTMAEAVRPETKDTLEKYVSAKLRYNRFDKALKSLIKLNLVVVKPELNAPDLYDLHPLVRQFVKHNFSHDERQDFISLVIGQYETIVKSLEKVLGFSLPLPLLGRWTQKAELEIEARQYKDAVESLSAAKNALIGGGHSEEFVRVTRSLLEAVDWNSASAEIGGFDKIVEQFVACLDELGDYSGADQAMERFKQSIPEKTARYIHYCDMKCYSLWIRGNYHTAIEWGEAGLELKKKTNVDTVHGSRHNLALAQRDAGDTEPALEYFLGETPLSELVDPDSDVGTDNGPKCGNVGRCLQFLGEEKKALACFRKSILALEDSGDSNRLSNRAYARQWIAECLLKQCDYRLALAFAISAEEILVKISPNRARKLVELRETIQSHVSADDKIHVLSEANRQVKKWMSAPR